MFASCLSYWSIVLVANLVHILLKDVESELDSSELGKEGTLLQ